MALVFVQFIHTLLFYFSGTASKLFYSIFLEKDLQVELLEIISMTAKLEQYSGSYGIFRFLAQGD